MFYRLKFAQYISKAAQFKPRGFARSILRHLWLSWMEVLFSVSFSGNTTAGMTNKHTRKSVLGLRQGKRVCLCGAGTRGEPLRTSAWEARIYGTKPAWPTAPALCLWRTCSSSVPVPFIKYRIAFHVGTKSYLTIIPRARMGSESIAHEAEGWMGYWLRAHSGSRNNCFSKIQQVGRKYRDKTTLVSFAAKKVALFATSWL